MSHSGEIKAPIPEQLLLLEGLHSQNAAAYESTAEQLASMSNQLGPGWEEAGVSELQPFLSELREHLLLMGEWHTFLVVRLKHIREEHESTEEENKGHFS